MFDKLAKQLDPFNPSNSSERGFFYAIFASLGFSILLSSAIQMVGVWQWSSKGELDSSIVDQKLLMGLSSENTSDNGSVGSLVNPSIHSEAKVLKNKLTNSFNGAFTSSVLQP